MGRKGNETPCNCVFRKIFQICHARFRQCSADPGHVGRVSVESNSGARNHGNWSMKAQEYVADFLLIARNTLGADSLNYRIFKYHYLLGADYKLINRKLGRFTEDRGTFHDFYRIEQRIGRALRETRPYSLFPVDEYFGGTTKRAKVIPISPRLLRVAA